jgi:nitroreductase
MSAPFPSQPTSQASLEHPIHPLLAQRFSPRNFDPNQAISEDQLQQLLEAARWTPSSFNQQPWRYLFACNRPEDRFEDLLGVLVPKNQQMAKDMGLLLLGVAQTQNEERNSSNRYATYDLGAANFALTVQAMSMGLYVHQMAGFDRELARERFQIGSGYEPTVVLGVGYLADEQPDTPPRKPRVLQTEFALRLAK